MIARKIRTATLRVLLGIAVALGLSGLAYRLHFNLSSATSVHLFLVVFIALRWGFLEASVVSVFSVACLDYFFTTPVFAFYMTDSHDWIALLTFEAAVLFVSRLSNQVIRHAQESETHQERLQKLYELSQHILLLDQMGEIEGQLADRIRSSLQAQGVALWSARDQRLSRSGICSLTDDEIQLAYEKEIDSDDIPPGTSLRVLRSGTRPMGALALCGHGMDSASVNAAASLASMAIERARSFSAEANAEAARQSEQLRSAILDGLAHAFKSPLTTIRVSSSGLLAMKTLSGGEEKLVGLIDRHAAQLSELTNHVLLTARLDGAELKVHREDIDLGRLIESCIETCSQDAGGHAVQMQTVSRRCRIHADAKLLNMAVTLVLDNALKYSRPDSPVVVAVREEATEAVITIANEGSFIPAEEREKVFQRFYRCHESAGTVSGTGIGLSVVKRIAEAHHGAVSVSSDLAKGTTFAISLPSMKKRGGHDAKE